MGKQRFKEKFEDSLAAIIAAKVENAIGEPVNCINRTGAMEAVVESLEDIRREYQKQLEQWGKG